MIYYSLPASVTYDSSSSSLSCSSCFSSHLDGSRWIYCLSTLLLYCSEFAPLPQTPTPDAATTTIMTIAIP